MDMETKRGHSKIVWVRLTDEQFEELNPTDGRSIGNEIRHRLFGEERTTDRGQYKIVHRDRQVNVRLSLQEYDSLVSIVPEHEAIGGFARRFVLSRIDNPDKPCIKCDDLDEYHKWTTVGLSFTDDEFEKFETYRKTKGLTRSAIIRELIFGR